MNNFLDHNKSFEFEIAYQKAIFQIFLNESLWMHFGKCEFRHLFSNCIQI